MFICIKNAFSGDYLMTLFNLAGAAIEEFNAMACLTFEGFSASGSLQDSLIEDDNIEFLKIREVFKDKYSRLISIGMFRNCELSKFKGQMYDPTNPLCFLLQTLHDHCGNSEQFLQSYFEEPFQNYLKFLASIVHSTEENEALNLASFNQYSLQDFPNQTLETAEEFNLYFTDNFSKYLQLITQLLTQFSNQILLTLSVIESHVKPIINDDYKKLERIETPTLLTFDELNKLLNDIYNKTEDKLIKDVKNKIREYLNKDYSLLKAEGGFFNIIIDQHNLITKLNNYKNGIHQRKPIEEVTDNELSEAAAQHSITLDNIAAINRLKFIIANIGKSLAPDEEYELWEKLAGIVSSKNSTYYSDIFELYVYTLLKKYGVPIKLLKSQVKGGNKISTCDYKVSDDIAADCKCIISSNAEFHQISEHSNKIGTQIKSTIGYENITFGGGMIGYRDRNFEFLKPFSEYNDDQNSRIVILNFIINCYSEFRRHTDLKSQEKIKFILIYYLPSSNIKAEQLRNVMPDSVEEKKEIFFLITTKYATQDEIKKVVDAFKTATPMIFRFNNYFN